MKNLIIITLLISILSFIAFIPVSIFYPRDNTDILNKIIYTILLVLILFPLLISSIFWIPFDLKFIIKFFFIRLAILCILTFLFFYLYELVGGREALNEFNLVNILYYFFGLVVTAAMILISNNFTGGNIIKSSIELLFLLFSRGFFSLQILFITFPVLTNM